MCCGGVTKESVTGATNPPPVLYENIDPLSQSSVQTAPSYENGLCTVCPLNVCFKTDSSKIKC